MEKQEASRKNIQKAIDARRLIGVSQFIKKLLEYIKTPALKLMVEKEFAKHGIKIGFDDAKVQCNREGEGSD